MTEFFGGVWWLIVSLGILVTFHEFGHYWVARRCGVRVLRFSIGFGPALWKRLGKDGTEYVVAMLPLGGYVKMLDEREVEVAPHERHESFNAKTVWQRIAIVAAGPVANLLLCVGLLWLMFMVGKPDAVPEIGPTTGLAAEAGLRTGDRLLAVGERETPTWTEAGMALSNAIMDREPTVVRVRRLDGSESRHTLALDRPGLVLREAEPFDDLGLELRLPPVIGTVVPGTPADGRLQPGDRVVSLAGEPIDDFTQIGPLVQRHAANGHSLALGFERAGVRRTLQIDPRLETVGKGQAWQLGIAPQAPALDAIQRFGPLRAVPVALAQTHQMASDVLGMLWRMVTGKASLRNISGPITIGQVAHGSANLGLGWFLNFLAVLSLSLCIMNLLPIPVLDGGHLLYYLIELVKGSPVGERALVAGQFIGLAMLASLMGLAFYNDIFHRLGS